jgi:hypothetical protein
MVKNDTNGGKSGYKEGEIMGYIKSIRITALVSKMKALLAKNVLLVFVVI